MTSISEQQRQKRIKQTESLDRHHGMVDPSADIDKQMELKGHRKLIREMLESLGPEDTRMFNEVLVKGESMAETARKMGIKYSTFECIQSPRHSRGSGCNKVW